LAAGAYWLQSGREAAFEAAEGGEKKHHRQGGKDTEEYHDELVWVAVAEWEESGRRQKKKQK
jgi:hypothetical protein